CLHWEEDESYKVLSGHEIVPAAAERAEKQKKLQVSRQEIQQRIQDREKDVKLLQKELKTINVSADKTVVESRKIFTELIRLLQKRSFEVKQQIRSQQKTEVSRVKDLQEKLEKEISELKRKDAELEQLSHTQDHNQFLLNYLSLPELSESKCPFTINVRPLRHFEDVTAVVSAFRVNLQDVLRNTWKNIKLMVTEVDVLLSKPKTRNDFLKYYEGITLDSNTAYRKLLLSEGNRKATKKKILYYSYHTDRFQDWDQVLSRQSLTGRHYWEVERQGKTEVAVSYKNISRSGSRSDFRYNDKSWVLYCNRDRYIFYHNGDKICVSGPVSSRIGVYLDHTAGILSFYSVSETMTLLHRVWTTFTQPLHAGVGFYDDGDSAEFINLR
ncbi:tripartite motif-containing protein 16-like, partial [Poeciliopsis prolifica]|uniref:tripartite motif-containing protein 16-like n=1 Tax=Poeciliopsis prolifica TaxID=188132 RepID=UPI0024131B14